MALFTPLLFSLWPSLLLRDDDDDDDLWSVLRASCV